MSPRGPRIWPSWPTTRIASGLATTTSKLISSGLHLRREILEPDDIRAGRFCGILILARREHRDAHRLADAMGHHGRTSHLLIGLAGVDAEIHGGVDRFVELGGREFLDELQRILDRILLARRSFAFQVFTRLVTVAMT